LLPKLPKSPSAPLKLTVLLLRLAVLCLHPFVLALRLMLRPFLYLDNRVGPISSSPLLGAAGDIARSRAELLLENALLRQQLLVLQRQVKRPRLNNTDRFLLALLASKLRSWKNALLIVQPDTLLRWHRAGFRLLWKSKSNPVSNSHKPKVPAETIALIKQMAQDNRLWGAERIRGALLKLDIRVAKRTIQKYMRGAREAGPTDGKITQTWATFLHNHASVIWACDFLQFYDLFFRPLFIFFIIERGSRRVVHFRVTRNPTDAWTAQQLREATPYGEVPKYLIHDNDRKFGSTFSRVAEVSGIKEVRIAYKAPKMNAICERYLGSVRRECLDHVLILSERQLHELIKEYVLYHNRMRPDQGIGPGIPAEAALQEAAPVPELAEAKADGRVIAFPALGGLHHHYRRAA
jgi:putative transposase